MNTPLISVVTINRNHAVGLARTLRSFSPLRSDSDIEFIFVDGASSDNSIETAQKFYRHNEIWSEPDKGIYDAMNKGLGLSCGKYVIWINSGDEILASSLLSAKPILKASKAAILAFAVEIEIYGCNSEDSSFSLFYNTPDRLPFQPLHHQSVFIKRHKAIQYRGYPTEYTIAADRALILAMYLSGEIFEYSNCIIARCEAQGISSNALRRENENYDLDLRHGLISKRIYLTGKCRILLYHCVTIPTWNRAKSIFRLFGISMQLRPRWLISLFKEPYRS